MLMKAVFLAVVLMAACVFGANYTKVVHNIDPEARCLDGSPAFLYVHQGGDTKNIMLYFVGGGLCAGYDLNSALESCYKRSKTNLGTSKKWPESMNADTNGIVSTLPDHSKFANWTKIVFMYCDGSLHQGNNKSPVQYKDTSLYFRGSVNTRAHIKWADMKYNLSQAERIMVCGSSAGGMATYLWTDHVRGLVPNPNVVYGVADSSVYYAPFINSVQNLTLKKKANLLKILNEDNQTDFQSLLSVSGPSNDLNPFEVMIKLANKDELPPNKQCSQLLTRQEVWKCLLIEWAYPTLTKPLLFVESSYDQLIIQGLDIHCLTKGKSGYSLKDCKDWQMNAIEAYRTFYLEKFVPNLLKWGHSIWTISCSWHAGMSFDEQYNSELQRTPKQQGPTIQDAVVKFVYEKKRVEAIDFFAWPANTPCAY